MSLQIAEQYEANEQYDKAYDEYKKLYASNPKDMNVIERLAHLAMMLGNKTDAADYYTKLLDFDMTNTMVYEQLMDIYQDTDRFKYYINRGNLHSIEHKYDHAINDFKKALANTQDEQDIIKTRFILASLYAQTGNNTKAIDEYLKLTDYDDIPSDTFLNLAKLYMAENALPSAINVLERACSKDIESDKIREQLALLYLRNNNPQKAREITKNNLLKAKCLLEEGDTYEAYKILEAADEKVKSLPNYHTLLAQHYFIKKEFDKALSEVDEFDRLEKNSPLTYQMRALINESQNDDYNAHLNWGRYQLVRGEKDIAINEFLNAYQRKDDDVNLVTTLAMLLEESGDKNHAMEFYEKLSKLEPNNTRALEKLADFRNSLGDYRAECDYLELWYEADKRNYKLIKRLAECYEKIKNKPSAVEFYKKYLTVAATADDYEKVKQHLAKLENTDIAPDEGEGLIDKIMRFFNKE